MKIKLEEKYYVKKKKNLEFLNLINQHISKNMLDRIIDCGSYLEFISNKNFDSKKLLKANFCKNRFCPFCAWRKSLKDSLKNFVLIKYLKNNFGYEFIFLTLTSPNVKANELENEIRDFNKSFERLMKRNELLKINKGYIRKLEITYDKYEYITKELYQNKKNYYLSNNLKVGDKNPTYDTYNPHFHIIIAVNKSYFKSNNYISKSKFLELWKECKRNSLITQIDVRKLSTNDKKAILEISKYSTKDNEYMINKNVFNVFYNALKGKQLITYNKAFKEALKLYKLGHLDYLKEIDITNYEFMISFSFINNNYELFSLKELTEKEKLKYNNKPEKYF